MGFVDVYRMITGWWSGSTAAPRGSPVPAVFVALPGSDQFLAATGREKFLAEPGTTGFLADGDD